MQGKSRQQGLEAGGHAACRHKVMNSGAQVTPTFTWLAGRRMVLPNFRAGLSTSIDLIEVIPHRPAWRFASQVIPESVSLSAVVPPATTACCAGLGDAINCFLRDVSSILYHKSPMTLSSS